MTMQIVVDETATGSLELVQRLAEVGKVNHQGDGFYAVEADHMTILALTAQYPNVVLKCEYVAHTRISKRATPMEYWRDFESLVAGRKA